MKETITSVGIDIGTSTTQLIFSRLTIENLASSYTVPRISIVDKEVIYRSYIYFTPLKSQQEIDVEAVRKIVKEEYEKAGMTPDMLQAGAVIIPGETARKQNANLVLEMLSDMAGDFVVATAGPDLESVLSCKGAGADRISEEERICVANVDIGGGTSDIAVISLDGVVVSSSIKVAGDDFDDAIVRFMRKRHNLLIGERSAEEIKINIGTCYKRPENISMDIRGRNLVTGLPKTVTVSSDETEEALREVTSQIVDAVHSVLERTPPELAADIADRGIVLTGGGALLHGLEDLIEENTGITTMTAEEPLTAVAIGTGKYIEFLSERK